MDVNALLTLAAPYGPVGLLCIYFLYREEKRDRREKEREERHEGMEEKRIEADKSLAVSLAILAERVKP